MEVNSKLRIIWQALPSVTQSLQSLKIRQRMREKIFLTLFDPDLNVAFV